MIHKVRSPKPDHVRVVFELPSSIWADRIFVTGDFNGWDRTVTPLHQDRNGVWRVTLDLRTGSRYEFRYLIDGQWSTDFHADGCTKNVYGSQNSVVVAELPAGARHDQHPHSTDGRSAPLRAQSGRALHTALDYIQLDTAA